MEQKRKTDKKSRLNELGERLKSLSKIDDSAAYSAVKLEIIRLLDEVYNPYNKKRPCKSYEEDAFSQTMLEFWTSFDPEKGSVTGFFTDRFTKRKKDEERKIKKLPKISLEGSQADEDSDDDESIDVPDEKGGITFEAEGHLFADLTFFEISSLILHFAERHNKKQGNDTRRGYFKLFYTSGVVSFVKMLFIEPVFQHHTQIIKAMNFGFVDYCMVKPCRLVSEIYHTSLKKYGEVYNMAGNDAHDLIPLPIPDTVVGAFLGVAKSTVSGHRNSYEIEIEQLMRTSHLAEGRFLNEKNRSVHKQV